MARSRNIKPGFFKNYELADAGPQVQLLFAGLWCLADKEGRLEDKPRLIKAELFPYYDFDVNGGLTVIERLGFIQRYKVCDLAVIQIINFKKHQNPHHTEKASVLPAIPSTAQTNDLKTDAYIGNGDLTVNQPLDNGEYPADSLIPDSLIPDSLIPDSLIPDSLIDGFTESLIDGKKEVAIAPCLQADPEKAIVEVTTQKNNKDLFDEFYKTYPRKEKRADAEKAWLKVDPALYLMIIDDVINRSTNHSGWTDKKYIPHPGTYLNGKRWQDEITTSAAHAGQSKASVRFNSTINALSGLTNPVIKTPGITHDQ